MYRCGVAVSQRCRNTETHRDAAVQCGIDPSETDEARGSQASGGRVLMSDDDDDDDDDEPGLSFIDPNGGDSE